MFQGEILRLSLTPTGGRAFLSLQQTRVHTTPLPPHLSTPPTPTAFLSHPKEKKKCSQKGPGLPGNGLAMLWSEQKYAAGKTKTVPLDKTM